MVKYLISKNPMKERRVWAQYYNIHILLQRCISKFIHNRRMIVMINFVNNGTDLEVLNKSFESMPLEQQQELSKALKRDGLVLVDVQVRGKHGVYTRKQWKKASDVKGGATKAASNNADAVGKDFSATVDSAGTKLEKEAHNLCVDRLKSEGVNLKNDNEVSNELAGYAMELKERGTTRQEKKHYSELANLINNWSGEYSAPTEDKKSTHNTGSTSDTSKETKAAVSDLRKQHGADKVMAAAKAAGISWKENSNAGINWMRCAMAIAKSSDKMQAVNDTLVGKTPKAGKHLTSGLSSK